MLVLSALLRKKGQRGQGSCCLSRPVGLLRAEDTAFPPAAVQGASRCLRVSKVLDHRSGRGGSSSPGTGWAHVDRASLLTASAPVLLLSPLAGNSSRSTRRKEL